MQLSEPAHKLHQQDAGQDKLHLELQLMQPLCDHEVLEACRRPAKRHRTDARRREDTPIWHERLDLGPCSMSWRAALVDFPPAYVDKITFDVLMPDATSADGAKLYWATQMDGQEGCTRARRDGAL